MAARCWLMKSEPSVYGIAALERDGRTSWDGVRNYQARNLLRDDIKAGDGVLFYHSSADRIGVAGVATVVREAYADPTQFVKGDPHEDPDSDPGNPRWFGVDIGFVERFADVVTLDEIKADAALQGMLVARRGMRLSVQPVETAHFERVVQLGRDKASARKNPGE